MVRHLRLEGRDATTYWSGLASSSGYDVRAAASAEQVSRRQLHRLCRRELGLSLRDWFRAQRLAEGRRWLLTTRSVKQAALEAGFRQVSHFCREFKRVHGLTPSEFLQAELVGTSRQDDERMSPTDNKCPPWITEAICRARRGERP